MGVVFDIRRVASSRPDMTARVARVAFTARHC